MVFYPAGTVLLDPASEMSGEGAKRNTLIHEALHWEKDKTYFEILKVKNALVAEKLSDYVGTLKPFMSHQRKRNEGK